MKGSRSFTKQAADEIVLLLGRTPGGKPPSAKALGQKLRDGGFYNSDFNRPAVGFGPDDFHDLVRQGVVQIK